MNLFYRPLGVVVALLVSMLETERKFALLMSQLEGVEVGKPREMF